MVTIKESYSERFRTIPNQVIHAPFEINLNDYEIHGYLMGQRVDKLNGLNLKHFDSIQVIKASENRLNKKNFVHAIGHRIKEKEFTILILKLKQ